MQYTTQDNMERRIAEYFGRTASQAPLSSGFWPRLRARLAMPGMQRFAWLRNLGAHRYILASAAGVGVLAVAGVLGGPPLLEKAGLLEAQDEAIHAGLASGPRVTAGAASPDRAPRVTAESASEDTNALGYGFSLEGRGIELQSATLSESGVFDAFSVTNGLRDEEELFLASSATDTPTPSATTPPSPSAQPAGQNQIDTAGRSIISTSGLAIEVESVPVAIDRARTVANAAGGFIESLSTTGGADPDRGSVTIRVPGTQFLSALAQVKEIGTVTGEQVTSDDVTDQVIDLEARLRSEQAKETSFIDLLDRATTVSDILNIERELSRVRTEIERLQGQLGFLEHRVDFATITVNFGKPATLTSTPPAASLAIRTKEVEDGVAQIKAIVTQAGGEIDNTSVSLRNDGLQAFVAFRVPPAEFDGVLFRVQQLGEVRAKEVRQPGTANDAEPSGDAVAKIDVTFNEPPADYNWWLIVGLPLGGVLVLAVVVGVGLMVSRRRAVPA